MLSKANTAVFALEQPGFFKGGFQATP